MLHFPGFLLWKLLKIILDRGTEERGRGRKRDRQTDRQTDREETDRQRVIERQ